MSSISGYGSSPWSDAALTQQAPDTSSAAFQQEEQEFFNNPDYQDQLKWFLSDAFLNGGTDPAHLGKLKGSIGAALIAKLAETNPALLGSLFQDVLNTGPSGISPQAPPQSNPGGGGGNSSQPNGQNQFNNVNPQIGNTGWNSSNPQTSGQASTQPQGSTGGSTGASGSSATGGGDGTSDGSGSVARGNPKADTYAQQNGQVTKDGSYTEKQCEADMRALAQKLGKQVPDDATITKIATGIIKGINANFSGVNTIGDFSKYSGAKMGKLLVSSAMQESDYGLYGEDDGGIFQCADIRLSQYNQANGTNYTEADLKNDTDLACDVGIWAMSTVEGTLGQQAPGSPAAIPSDLGMQALYYWNYHGGSGHGHADELSDYMQQAQSNLALISGS